MASKLTDEEKSIIKQWYFDNSGDLKLHELAARIGRPMQNICRAARRMGLTSASRKKADRVVKALNKPGRWQGRDHPKGYEGKRHSDAVRAVISQKGMKRAAREKGTEKESQRILKQLKTKEANGTLYPPKHGRWQAGWYVIGDRRIYMRSSWEYKYALLLEEKKRALIIKEWEFEPKTFWFENILRGVRSYLPDFRITWPDDSIEYHEVKGWMDPKSATKIKRMAKYHPEVKLEVLIKKAYERAISLRIIPNEKKNPSSSGEQAGVMDWLAKD